jgi:hypothetical protein
VFLNLKLKIAYVSDRDPIQRFNRRKCLLESRYGCHTTGLNQNLSEANKELLERDQSSNFQHRFPKCIKVGFWQKLNIYEMEEFSKNISLQTVVKRPCIATTAAVVAYQLRHLVQCSK